MISINSTVHTMDISELGKEAKLSPYKFTERTAIDLRLMKNDAAQLRRMIKWATLQPVKYTCYKSDMLHEIGENWSTKHRHICLYYHTKCRNNKAKCPYLRLYNDFCFNIKEWKSLYRARNWSTWCKAARGVLKLSNRTIKKLQMQLDKIVAFCHNY